MQNALNLSDDSDFAAKLDRKTSQSFMRFADFRNEGNKIANDTRKETFLPTGNVSIFKKTGI